MKELFKGDPCDFRIIIEALVLYCHFSLSYCDCEKIMRKFRIGIDHTTIGEVCCFFKLCNRTC